jgi:hypothetical protein
LNRGERGPNGIAEDHRDFPRPSSEDGPRLPLPLRFETPPSLEAWVFFDCSS